MKTTQLAQSILKSTAKAETEQDFVPRFREIEFPEIPESDLFANIASENPMLNCFLFSRLEEGTRFVTYIGIDPFESVTVRGGVVEVENEDGFFVLDGDQLKNLQSRLDLNKSEKIEGRPSFQGGAFGYFAYDFVRHLEPRLKAAGYFQALERDPQHVDAEILFFDRLIILDHSRKQAYVMAREGSDCAEQLARLAHLAETACRKMTASSTATIPVELPNPMEFRQFELSFGRENFMSGVEKLKSEIAQGEIFQAVLSEKLILSGDYDAHALFRKLCEISPTPYRFHLQFSGVNRIGCSPEMLLKVENGKLETHPIAGTRPRGSNDETDRQREAQLRQSSKERAEHLMLVDLARNDLGQVSRPGTVQVVKYREVVKFNSVMHLVSKVTGELRGDKSTLAAFAACFPAGTLSGAPKIRAMEILAGIEQTPRGFYGGAVVMIGFDGDMDSCIAIRSAEVSQGQVVLQAGAGVVADSSATREYEEVMHKTRSLRLSLAVEMEKRLETV